MARQLRDPPEIVLDRLSAVPRGRSRVGPLAWSAILAAAGLVLVETHLPDSGWTWDAVRYISTARALAAGEGLRDYAGVPYQLWPPLFPLLLACGAKIGWDPSHSWRVLNAFALAASLFVTYRAWLAAIPARSVRNAALVLLVLSPALLQACAFALTEPVFILLSLCALATMTAIPYAERPVRYRLIAAAAVLTALALLQRYAALPLVAVGLLAIALRPPSSPMRGVSGAKRIAEAAGFLVVALSPIAAWIAHLAASGAGPLGPRTVSPFALRDILGAAVDILSLWILPAAIPFAARALAIAVIASGTVLLLLRARRGVLGGSGSDALSPTPLLLVVWTALYLLFIVGSAARIHLEPLNERFLAPLHPVLVVLAALLAQRALTSRAADVIPGRVPRLAALLVGALLLGALLTGPILRTSLIVHRGATTGFGDFADPRDGLPLRWSESPTAAFLREEVPRPDDLLFSNQPDAVHIFSGRRAAPPPRTASGATDFRDAVARASEGGRAPRLAWFHRTDPLRPYPDTAALARLVRLDLLRAFADGAVYRMLPLSPGDEEAPRPARIPAAAHIATTPASAAAADPARPTAILGER